MSYKSQADLGGQPGHGPVVPEAEGELFHAGWEKRALALTLAMGATGSWNIDMSRAARETLPDYAHLSYYEIWLHGLQVLLQNARLADAEEVSQGQALHSGAAVARVLHAGEVAAVLAKGSPTERPAMAAARFGKGQRVRTRSGEIPHHTRLPGYVKGKVGVIEQVLGVHVFADTHAQGLGEQPEWLYTVVFDEDELWGARDAPQGIKLSVDAWEPYLEAA